MNTSAEERHSLQQMYSADVSAETLSSPDTSAEISLPSQGLYFICTLIKCVTPGKETVLGIQWFIIIFKAL